jgi:hypothetical protein
MSTSKVYQIRYNTVSKDDTERWRLIENGSEILVANIIIDGSTYTTKDWMEEIQDYKWHVTCEGHCEVKNNIAYIKTVKEKSVLVPTCLEFDMYCSGVRAFGSLVYG